MSKMKMTNPAALMAFASGDIENALVASTPGGIEAQEKRGQMALVNSTDMPKEMRPNREAFEKIGFKFGDDVDDLFISATLPAGWSKAATDHSMHSTVLDEQGRERVCVFYKAAFYDRRANCYLTRRFTTATMYPDMIGGEGLASDEVRVVVLDAGNVIHQMPPTKRRDYAAGDVSGRAALEWLKERYPEHDDPTAYWSPPHSDDRTNQAPISAPS